jgi:hypothetical protein
VEFLRGGTVAGREVASVVPNAEISAVANGPVPGMGSKRVELLKGGEYLRVWMARSGMHYLVHLRVASK